MTVSETECSLIKLLPYISFEKYIYILVLEMASPGNQHCDQLYRNTVVAYSSEETDRHADRHTYTPLPCRNRVIMTVHVCETNRRRQNV